ncbi:unnamed protein product [Notodromas monacha]|uniref:Mediator of RNA polymerase II transcription subunit 11 n=1 Tax=Notodromas monacha TaxID=399045 RepID=A0A7R9G991_9CRUS|nr:unnamed protein product [Notodromas monacha]CAG0912367.1 unnamed protein product [Notodromas monacha]
MTSMPLERLKALDEIEKDIAQVLTSASHALAEISKDKPSQKQVDQHNTQFLNTLSSVETELTKHINYLIQVSTGQPHEGSSYAAQKSLLMAGQRLDHSKRRLSELESIKNHYPLPSVPRPAFGGPNSNQSVNG